MMRLYCDNKSTIKIVYNLIKHDRIIQIEVVRYFVKEMLSNLICTCMSSTQGHLHTYSPRDKYFRKFQILFQLILILYIGCSIFILSLLLPNINKGWVDIYEVIRCNLSKITTNLDNDL